MEHPLNDTMVKNSVIRLSSLSSAQVIFVLVDIWVEGKRGFVWYIPLHVK